MTNHEVSLDTMGNKPSTVVADIGEVFVISDTEGNIVALVLAGENQEHLAEAEHLVRRLNASRDVP